MMDDRYLIERRQFMRRTAGAIALAAGSVSAFGRFARGAAPATQPGGWPAIARFPEKTDLILQTDRPPNLETPLRYFREDLTPNDAFYVRWHLGELPTRIDTDRFRLSVAGLVEKPVSLSLDELRRDFEPVSVVAV